MKKNIPFIISLIFVITIPVFGIAVSFENPLKEVKTITDLISELINFLFNVAIFICAIIIVYSGLLYITAAGNQQKIQTAHKSLAWALIGLAIVLIANYVPGIIKDVLYGSEESSIQEEYTPAEPGLPPSEPGLPPSEPGLPPEEEVASGTYKVCRPPLPGSWAWITGHADTLYCKEENWEGVNPGDKCSVLNEVCSEGAGAF